MRRQAPLLSPRGGATLLHLPAGGTLDGAAALRAAEEGACRRGADVRRAALLGWQDRGAWLWPAGGLGGGGTC